MAEEQLQKLRDVFSLIDCDKRGCITVERFFNVAREHFCGAFVDEVMSDSFSTITKILDPEGKGEINFSQFCEGVKQIIERKAAADKNAKKLMALNPNEIYAKCDLLQSDVDEENEVAKTVSCSKSLPSNLSSDLVLSGDADSDISDDVDRLSYPGNFDSVDCVSMDGLVDIILPISSCDIKASVPEFQHNSPVNSRWLKSSPVTSHLHHGASVSVLTASGRSSSSNVMLEDIDENFLELNGKVKLLEDQIYSLTENQRQNADRQTRIKDENLQMIDRVRILEEQLREVEFRSLDKLCEEQRKSRELMIRLDKEKSREVDLLMQSYNEVDKECAALKEDVPKLRLENERLCKENRQRMGLIEELRQRISELSTECERLRQQSREEQIEMSRESYVQAQLLEELGKELDELRSFRSQWIDQSLDNPNIKQYRELEECVASLKQENDRLRDEIDDLHTALLQQEVPLHTPDLSSGLTYMSRQEMMDAIKKEQESNQILRNYVEQITLRILEKNPSILEVMSSMK